MYEQNANATKVQFYSPYHLDLQSNYEILNTMERGGREKINNIYIEREREKEREGGEQRERERERERKRKIGRVREGLSQPLGTEHYSNVISIDGEIVNTVC